MESKSVTIKSSRNPAELQISERSGVSLSDRLEHYFVNLKHKDFTVSTKVYAFQPNGETCQDYFDDLANNWKGWTGKKEWSSFEGEFTISSETDSLGHIEMKVALDSFDNWNAQISINIDAGQLENISLAIKRFFSPTI